MRCRQDPAPQGAAVTVGYVAAAVSLLLPLVLVNGTDHDGATVRFFLSASLLRSKEEKRKEEKEQKLEALERPRGRRRRRGRRGCRWLPLVPLALLALLTPGNLDIILRAPCLAALVRCLRLACGALGLPGLTVDTCTYVSPGGFWRIIVIFCETVDLGFWGCFL